MDNNAPIHNREAEEAVLASVLIDPGTLTDLHFLTPGDFYIHRNRWAWEAIQRLNEKRLAIDIVTAAAELENMGKLADVTPAYLTGLVACIPTSYNAVSYAQIVQEMAIRRRAEGVAGRIVTAARNGELEQLEEALAAAPEIAFHAESDNTFADGLSAVYDRAERNAERTRKGEPLEVGLTTGFIDLDRILLGIEAEESVIIGGRPGDGKTAFLLNIAAHAALTLGKRVAVFSQEMSNEEVARRLVSSYTEIDSQRIKIGKMDPGEWSKFTDAITTLENSGLYVSDVSNLTPAKLRAKCLQLKQTQGLDLVLVDYIQLMSAGIKTENRTREVGYISRHIKMLAREIHTPIISACQLSRAVEQRAEKRPTLSDLRDAGDLEQDANTVMFLYRPQDVNKQNAVEVIVAKRRDGAVGSAELVYRPPITKFVNAASRVFRLNEEEG